MDKQDFLEVLAHQVKGIMFHTELVHLFTLMKMEKCRKFQLCQLCEEMKYHIETSRLYINIFGALPELGNIERIKLSESIITAPNTESEKIAWYEKAVDLWVEWEKLTLSLYSKMSDYDPQDKFWKFLTKHVQCELEKASKLQMKYTFVKDSATNKSVVMLRRKNTESVTAD